ncbi:MAG: SDR family oxidoreductase [Clostridia bacterium]|nr:SDR family oxidoreductase [Clostridia bacterium]
MRKLNGLSAIITGAAGGIGSEIARMLADDGVKLTLLSQNSERLAALSNELSAKTDVISRVIDVRDDAQVSAAIDVSAETFGAPDFLLNLAGLSIPAKLWDMSAEDYETTLDVNVKGTFLMCKHFARVADSEKGALILNTGSMAAKRANGNAPLYCTAKAAVNMLSSGMQIQYKEKNIRVTTINPGGADTPFWGSRPVAREKLLRASDVAEVFYFVMTRDSRVVFSELNFESFLNQ